MSGHVHPCACSSGPRVHLPARQLDRNNAPCPAGTPVALASCAPRLHAHCLAMARASACIAERVARCAKSSAVAHTAPAAALGKLRAAPQHGPWRTFLDLCFRWRLLLGRRRCTTPWFPWMKALGSVKRRQLSAQLRLQCCCRQPCTTPLACTRLCSSAWARIRP